MFKKTGINEDKAGLLREENIAKYDFLKENLYSQCNSIQKDNGVRSDKL